MSNGSDLSRRESTFIEEKRTGPSKINLLLGRNVCEVVTVLKTKTMDDTQNQNIGHYITCLL